MFAQSTMAVLVSRGLPSGPIFKPKCFHASEVVFFGISTVGATAGDEDTAIVIIISIKTRQIR